MFRRTCHLGGTLLLEIIPRKLRACSGRGGTKGCKDGQHPFFSVPQSMPVRESYDLFLFGRECVSSMPQTLGLNDGLETVARFLQLVVDQNEIILVVVLNLAAGLFQPAIDRFVVVFTPLAQSPLKSLAIGRK